MTASAYGVCCARVSGNDSKTATGCRWMRLETVRPRLKSDLEPTDAFLPSQMASKSGLGLLSSLDFEQDPGRHYSYVV